MSTEPASLTAPAAPADPVSGDPGPEPPAFPRPRLGPLLGWFVGLLALHFGLQTVGFVAYGLLLWTAAPPAGQGFAVALAVAAVPMVAATWWVARRLTGNAPAYLGWRMPSGRVAAAWTGITAVAVVLLELFRRALGEPAVPDFVAEVYATAGWLPLFWVSVCVLAVIVEEMLFRGLLLPGLAAHWGGPAAILVTVLLFAVIHLGQYGWVDLAVVFALGLIFGVVRWRTGSLPLAMGLHGLVNLVALVQAHYVLAS